MRLTLLLLVVALSGCTRAPAKAQTNASNSALTTGARSEVRVTRDLTFARNGGSELKLDIYQPWPLPAGQKLPVVIYFHGGGWRSGDKEGGALYLDALARRGFLGISANYRLSGQAKFPAQYADALAAVQWAEEHAADFGGSGPRIGVFGTSAGGHLAALLGTTGEANAVRAVADWYGPADLRDAGLWPRKSRGILEQLLGGTPAQQQQLASGASPVAQVSSGDVPFLIVHGDRDDTVPVEQSRILRDALKSAGVPVQYVEVTGGGHGNFGKAKTAELIETTAEFFHSHL